MPENARRPPKASTMILTSAGGVVAGIVIFLIVLALAGPKSAEQSRGATFKVGKAERLAAAVARDGPLLFPDLLNRGRDIFVQHLGGDEWRAFDARPAGTPRSCTLTWRPATRDFYDPCSARIYPGDGTGLVQYPATVDEDGTLIADLSTVATTTTTPPATPTTTAAPAATAATPTSAPRG